MSVVTTKECAVRSSLALVETFAAEKMCRKCVPCVFAITQMADALGRLTRGDGVSGDTERLRAIAAGMDETVMCKLGRDIALKLERTLGECAEQFADHEQGRCPQGSCAALLTFAVIAEKCTLCGTCKEVCPYGAIVGEKPPWYVADCLPFQIRTDKCTGCGLCVAACEPGAIVVRLGGDTVA